MNPDAWLETELPRLLPAFLQTQRWFGGKAREIHAVGVEDAVWLGAARHDSALIIVELRYTDCVAERYAMLLGFVEDVAGLPVVGRVEHSALRTWVVEAAADPRAALALLGGFASPMEIPMMRGGRLRYGDAGAAAELGVARAAAAGSITSLGAEQSNTTLRLDSTLVFKLFRRLHSGENPELEVGRFLASRTTFRAMAMLRGSVTYVPARGEPSTLGVLQDWIKSNGDGWTHVIRQLRESTPQASKSLQRDLSALGATTADFHAALATDTTDRAFAPEPVTATDLQTWRASFLERATLTFSLVERSMHGWTEDNRRIGETLLNLKSRAPAFVSARMLSRGFDKIRIHGDYHLGQVLKTSDGFAVIDFEGEPGRPFAERKLKHCALKDVAGMIRSFSYAVNSALGPESSDGPNDTMSVEHLRKAFLDGYLTSAPTHDAALLPGDRRAIDAWIDFFEMEKALYEIEYEINSRPTWVGIPLRGIVRILRHT